MVALVISSAAIVVSAWALIWQYRVSRRAERLYVQVEPRALVVASAPQQQAPDYRELVVGVRVFNRNPKYPIRVNSVAFTPADVQSATEWFTGQATFSALPLSIEPRDAETIDLPIERISETDPTPLGEMFIAWVELKTGEIFRTQPHPAPRWP
jgi:hypothetical protein